MRRVATILIFSLGALASGAHAQRLGEPLTNPTAYIPPQCYTRTTDAAGEVHNPCFTCHVRGRRPNAINDQDLQLSYAFPEPALKNRWVNLFEDRSARVNAISDADILAYVRTSNYLADDGSIALTAKLDRLPEGWDANDNGTWDGFRPDAFFRFDDEGYDLKPDGTRTGWRAFAYTPLPGSFSPASGSTDDVLIRLPEAYRQDADGRADWSVYAVNLAIVEALIARQDVAIDPVDEAKLGVDLDKDGKLATASKVAFDWAPLEGRDMSYVGRAKALQEAGDAPLAVGLYPLGTEFVHTVRYVDVDDATGEIAMAARVKELRYMRKTVWQTYADLEDAALEEMKEDHDFPDRIPIFDGDAERGISNGAGWRLQAFIEDREGDLRPQSFEETVFCTGCHGGVGATDDSTFAFPRKLKVAEPARGWFHWTQHGLTGIADPVRADGWGEYARYLKENGAGDEFRSNADVIRAFFDSDGAPDTDALKRLREDVAALLYPTRQRALELDKAYRTIVLDQDFLDGRDAQRTPVETVEHEVEQDQPTGIVDPVPPRWRR